MLKKKKKCILLQTVGPRRPDHPHLIMKKEAKSKQPG